MPEAKNTRRASVHIGYDGRVHKSYRDQRAEERMATEVAVLRHLEEQKCPFVPQLIDVDWENKRIVTTNCGTRVQHLSSGKIKQLFAKLEHYGVRPEDPFLRNITYRKSDGEFCLIDFEFATLLDDPSVSLKPDLASEEGADGDG
jgi:tRNA A-37 threonylcarbamoyl transferase component Bud32